MKIKLLVIIFIALFVSAGSLGGCASKNKNEALNTFDETTRLYGRMLRWGEYEGAVKLIRHQDESSVEVDMDIYKELHVTDYDIKKIVMGEELKTAVIEADISYYFETSSTVRELRDSQSWWYDEEVKQWFLDDDLPAF